METYTALRHFADSWALLGMFLAFCAVVWWVFRPGAAKAHHEAATQIFRNEDAPMPEATSAPGTDGPATRQHELRRRP
jgi:cytochrome c oxidase cbb3-type subunit 4